MALRNIGMIGTAEMASCAFAWYNVAFTDKTESVTLAAVRNSVPDSLVVNVTSEIEHFGQKTGSEEYTTNLFPATHADFSSAAASAAQTGWTTKVIATDGSDIDQTDAHKLDASAVLFTISVTAPSSPDSSTYTIGLELGTLTAGDYSQFKYIFSKSSINGSGTAFSAAEVTLNNNYSAPATNETYYCLVWLDGAAVTNNSPVTANSGALFTLTFEVNAAS